MQFNEIGYSKKCFSYFCVNQQFDNIGQFFYRKAILVRNMVSFTPRYLKFCLINYDALSAAVY